DEERIGDLASDLFGEREDVLRSLRGEVLDEVRLVNNHSLEPEITHPPQVSVEDLVVDDEDVGKGVHLIAVAVDDRDRSPRGPQLDLAGPVDLHDVGDHYEERKGLRYGGCHDRLRGLAQPGFVGEEELPVPGFDGFEEAHL